MQVAFTPVMGPVGIPTTLYGCRDSGLDVPRKPELKSWNGILTVSQVEGRWLSLSLESEYWLSCYAYTFLLPIFSQKVGLL